MAGNQEFLAPLANDFPAPPRILLVEDHDDTSRILARLLRREGYEVRTAGSLAEALESSRALPFDLLISDIGLPDGTGWELIRLLQGSRPFHAIALSGLGTDADFDRSREAGFAMHLVKPVSLQRLESVIRQLTAPWRPRPA